jgi:hypothetical protein
VVVVTTVDVVVAAVVVDVETREVDDVDRGARVVEVDDRGLAVVVVEGDVGE